MKEGSQEAAASTATVSNPPLPVRMVNEFAYCTGLGYLI
jgi:hypothetical protein